MSEKHDQEYQYWFDWDWPGAGSQLQEALELDPNNSPALDLAGDLQLTIGNFDQALVLLQNAVADDPFNSPAYYHLGRLHRYARRLSEARVAFSKMLALNPEVNFGHGVLGLAMHEAGDPATQVVAEIERGNSDEERKLARPNAYDAYVALGRKQDADLALAELEKNTLTSMRFRLRRFMHIRAEAIRHSPGSTAPIGTATQAVP